MREWVIAVPLAYALLSVAQTAHAEPVSVPVARAPAREDVPGPRPWYGWQLLLVDGAIFTGLGIAEATDRRGSGVTTLGVAGFLIASPIIHAAHSRGGMAGASFGVRAGLATWVAVTTILPSPCSGEAHDNTCGESRLNVSSVVAFALASAIDASLFAWENPKVQQPSRATLEWTPMLAPRTDGATIGVVGAF